MSDTARLQACLPMYDHPGLRHETDALWAALRDAFRAGGIAGAPDALWRGDDVWQMWTSPQLLLGQTCGLPYRTPRPDGRSLYETHRVIGTFDYGLPDTPPGRYHSVLVARADDPRDTLAAFSGATLAYNEDGSQSGWAAAVDTGIAFRLGTPTGAHAESLRAVVSGRADIAALDAVSWRIQQQFHPEVTGAAKVILHTPPVPGLPLITAFAPMVDRLRDGIRQALDALSPQVCLALGLKGFVEMEAADYLQIPLPPTAQAYAAENAG